ncbi:hypothetical protein BCON_0456g00040 [Botryotinia convoluta]|uniref:Uncharacterized protein n=1 Tax=Botryotinia convoluta TaxID=54673 RepID=A0A4Z1H7P9_9HELO|nr:hypothetical protein BCON_0456g00040 [Botryotinia convoluta]
MAKGTANGQIKDIWRTRSGVGGRKLEKEILVEALISVRITMGWCPGVFPEFHSLEKSEFGGGNWWRIDLPTSSSQTFDIYSMVR